eukprot:CAMPEP_0180516446 /NCGR_PEP_ID=MMETSP1036_2-20121128/53921_2 /TAXON_ID=632150 /ORGANISM="Azadinium spinosum, Strain 3D9" /LENGTH=61 /DNA_ID=CAMNT_0022528243 /DNA_START=177 /DNA_END=362 /DNA_ORIENTATION=-
MAPGVLQVGRSCGLRVSERSDHLGHRVAEAVHRVRHERLLVCGDLRQAYLHDGQGGIHQGS